MIQGDPGAESVFHWDRQGKGVDRRGAGPNGRDAASAVARARGWACTSARARSPSAGAEPGDILEVRILDVRPRPCANPQYRGQELRQQCRRLVGLSLQGSADGAASRARSSPSTRSTPRASGLGAAPSTASGGRRRPIRSGWCTRPSTIRACPSTTGRSRRTARRFSRVCGCPIRPHFGVLGVAPERGRYRRLDPARLLRRQYRRLADRQGRDDVLPRRRRRRALLRRRLRTRRRATPSCAAPPSNARSPARSSSSCTKATRSRARRSPSSTTRCSRRRTSGSCTASATRTTSPSWARRADARSTRSRRSISRCATPSARCATS